ncbi:tRNA (guanosine(37)-N1)-methyltransferase TrmD [Candidatus Nomurabacteria bacterium]|nr:tRNA (guanosine(37)-N1)-methyltransferase TrmD [Candidatus Nomurabacteria bacterium]
MKIDIITIFPDQIKSFILEGIFRIAQERSSVEINVHNLRKWATDKHKTVDDRPYGGGAGMVMKVEPIYNALSELKTENTKVVLMTPKGSPLKQETLKRFVKKPSVNLIIMCGHYEGVDYRVHEYLIDEEISIGDYVLSGGELPALVLVDGIIRLIPGVLGNSESSKEESFENSLLEYPQYTRPEIFNDWGVPKVLLKGNHREIDKWRSNRARSITRKTRPELF